VTHLELLLAISASYGASLLLYERWRRFRGRARGLSPKALRRVHYQGVLAPLLLQAPQALAGAIPEIGQAATRGDLVEARSRWTALASEPGSLIPEGTRSWVEAALLLGEAEQALGTWRRYELAARARWAARRASRRSPSSAGPRYLWLLANLGYLADPLNSELVLLHSGWALRRALEICGPDPLLYLAAALRATVAGRTVEATDALARALYHGRGDRFIAGVIAGLPSISELAPTLADQAAQALRFPERPGSS
jgi:hypothetical protein